MPSGLLQSRPFTIDGYAGDGLCPAIDLLGRNKGLNPGNLLLNTSKKVATSMENFGTWVPRPNKVLLYSKALEEQYGRCLGAAFVGAATELTLLMTDVLPAARSACLRAGIEQRLFHQVEQATGKRGPSQQTRRTKSALRVKLCLHDHLTQLHGRENTKRHRRMSG